MIKVYYHENCFDGMCSAWVAWRKFGYKAEYIPINYGQSFSQSRIMEECDVNDIYFVDFSLPRKIMDVIYTLADKLVVLDHHKTAEIELRDAPYAIFDMNESGASLTWKHFFNCEPPPLLVRYIKDRDLWKFNEYKSKEVNAFIQSFEMTIDNYDILNNYLGSRSSTHLDEAIVAGTALLRYQDKLVKDMCKNFIIRKIGGYEIPVVNASVLFSEVGHELCLKGLFTKLFSAYYFDRNNKRQWGLRSIGDFDVSEIAKKYGGGGHRNAAGFETGRDWLGDD